MIVNIRRVSSWTLSLAYSWFHTLQNVAWSVCCWFFIVGIVFIGSSSSYVWFYSKYVPTALHEVPAHFTFSTCETGSGICSFPVANLTLSKHGLKEVLSCGQAYKVILELQMPESEKNTEAGMFMINIKMYGRHGTTIEESARSVMLKYRSYMVSTLMRLLYFFPILTGLKDESQDLQVPLFEEFIENPYHQTRGAVLELRSMKIDIYQAVLKIYAQFSGLSYFLYYWPLLSALVGISSIFLSLMFVIVIGRFAYRERATEEENSDWETSSNEETSRFPRDVNLDQQRQRAHDLLRRERGARQEGPERGREVYDPDTIAGTDYGAVAGDLGSASAFTEESVVGSFEEEEEEPLYTVEELLLDEGNDDPPSLRHRTPEVPAQ